MGSNISMITPIIAHSVEIRGLNYDEFSNSQKIN